MLGNRSVSCEPYIELIYTFLVEMGPSYCKLLFFHVFFPYLQVNYLLLPTKGLLNEYTYMLAICFF